MDQCWHYCQLHQGIWNSNILMNGNGNVNVVVTTRMMIRNSVYLNFILFRSWRLLHIHSIIRVPLFSIFLHFNPIFKWSWNNLLLGKNHLLILIDQPTDRPTKPTHRNSNSHIKSTTKPTHTPTYFLFIRKRNTFGPIQFSLIINCKVCSAD